MKVDLARRLNSALAGIDAAKSNLAIACSPGGSDESIEAAGDRYEEARAEMGATMKAIADDGAAPEQPPA